ncbi:MAG: T9SS type A sorting domain-containing protein [Chitinophagaceae bacterium]|nr:T9SS type A sorting domain-containing protein [Chitinophagaceae bacterium]
MKRLLCNLCIVCFLFGFKANATTITTSYVTNTIIFSTGSTYITFAVKNNNAYSVILTNITTLQADLYNDNEFELWYSTTSVSGAPTIPSAAWTLATSSIDKFNTNAYDYVTPFDCIGVLIPPNTTMRFALRSNKGTCVAGGVTPNIFSSGGVDLLVGNNTSPGAAVGYFGWTNIGNSGTNYFFDGSITFEQTTAYNDIQVSKIITPAAICGNATDNVTARICSKSTKSILMSNNNINVNFNINGPTGTFTPSVTLNSGSLTPCGCVDATVPINMSAQGNYTITATASLVGSTDINLANNTRTDSIRNYKAVTNGNQIVCQNSNIGNFSGFSSSGCTTSNTKKQTITCTVNSPILPDGSSDATASLFATGILPQLPDGAQITGARLNIQNLISNGVAGNTSNQARFNIYGPAPNNQTNPFLPGYAGNALNFGVYNFEYRLQLNATILNAMYAALGVGGTFNIGYWESVDNSSASDIGLNAQTFPTTCKIEIDYVINPISKWYLTSSGGSSFYNGSPFNPFIIPGSGINNTSNLTTVTYYAACSADTTCRVPVSLTVISSPQVVQDSMETCETPAGTNMGYFDLSSISNNVSNNNVNATVDYFLDQGLSVACLPINNFNGSSGFIYSKVSIPNGCYSSDSVLLVVHQTPQFFSDPYDKTVCSPASIDAANVIDIFSTSPPGTDTLYYEDAACTIPHPNPHNITASDTVYIVFKTNTQPFCTDTALATFNLLIPDGSIASQDTTFDISVCTVVNVNNYMLYDNNTTTIPTSTCQKVVTITDNNNGISLGLTTVEEVIDCSTQIHNGQPYLNRHYHIEPTTQDSATVCLYFLDDDLAMYNQDAPTYNFPAIDPYTNLVVSKVNNGDITDPSHTSFVINNSDITKSFDPVNNVWTICFHVDSFSYFYMHSANPFNTPLPVYLNSFTGKKVNETAELNWVISSATNADYFIVERSRDGKNFTAISTQIPLVYNQGELQSKYQFVDMQPFSGNNFYRLRTYDVDGKSVQSGTVEVFFGEFNSVQVYPNPAHDMLNLDIAVDKKSAVWMELTDLTGRVVLRSQAELNAGSNSLKMNLSQISSGIYTLLISNGKGFIHTEKVRKD